MIIEFPVSEGTTHPLPTAFQLHMSIWWVGDKMEAIIQKYAHVCR